MAQSDDFDALFRMMFGIPVPDRFARSDSDEGPVPVEAVVDEPADAAAASGTSAAGASATGSSAGPQAGSAAQQAGEAAQAQGASRKQKGPRGRKGGARGRKAAGAGRSGGGRWDDDLRRMADQLPSWSVRAVIVAAVLLVVIVGGCYWWFHPALNLQSPFLWMIILCVAALAIFGLLIASVKSWSHGRLLRRLCLVPGAVVLVFVVGVVTSLPIFPGNAERYASVLETEEGDFEEDIEEVDYSEVPVIDRDSAELLGDRAMGSISDYVSQFEVAETYSQINYQDGPVRVSPLVYADLFKWWANREEGIPAYVIVDMVTQEAEVVRLEEGIKYSESEPFFRNIDRYTQLKYPTYIFDEKSFELDEDGTPWWVFPVQKKTIGLFGGTTISRVVLVNACTGETYDYAVEDCPEWVDRAYTADLIIEQYNWSGAYSGGWLNSWLGQQGVVKTTDGTDGSLGYNYLAQDGDIYLYTGVTSATADSSIVGFILVNQRTGESRYYSVAGATEGSAMSSAEGAVQNYGYEATFPLLLNIAGQPTYFMALKDDTGLVKMFAMINVEEYQDVATGSTVAATQENYLAMLEADGKLTSAEVEEADPVATLAASGTIASIAQAVIDGNSHFYVMLEGDDGIYDFALPDLLEIVRYGVGDTIAFVYVQDDDADGVYEVTAFG